MTHHRSAVAAAILAAAFFAAPAAHAGDGASTNAAHDLSKGAIISGAVGSAVVVGSAAVPVFGAAAAVDMTADVLMSDGKQARPLPLDDDAVLAGPSPDRAVTR